MPVRGLSQTLSALNNYSQSIQDDIKDAVEETTLQIERQAILNAPSAGQAALLSSSNLKHHGQNSQKNNTNIASFIGSNIFNQGFSGEIFVDATAGPIAAYFEFGTGASAAGYVPTLPKEWQEIARSYYINGRGTLIKHPFLLPAYFEYAPKLEEKIIKILKTTKL